MKHAYYNEFDPKAAAWLRELIKRGLIAPGDVDERSIKDVKADEIRSYTQVHLFAGIGGWSLALRLAGWPDDRHVWTGSCPCQPFSTAGKRKGVEDDRHLWPEMFRLVRECRPAKVFGEQVAAAIRLGWLDGVFADLEKSGYACGSAVLGAHSVQSPHKRQRLFWVADAECAGVRSVERGTLGGAPQEVSTEIREQRIRPDAGAACGAVGGLGDTDSRGQQQDDTTKSAGSTEPGFWADGKTILCGDRKARRLGPGITPLAHGIPARVVRLRGYGNAIVPEAAAAFVAASE